MKQSKEARVAEIMNLLERKTNSFRAKVENILAECPTCKLVSVQYGYKSATIVLEPVRNTNHGANHIEVRYCHECGRFQKEEFSTNLAAKGSFELLKENMAARYYIAAGCLLSNKYVLVRLKEEMMRFSAEVYNLREEYEKLDKN